jgi:Fur family transcriptional regulator, iron response regulator
LIVSPEVQGDDRRAANIGLIFKKPTQIAAMQAPAARCRRKAVESVTRAGYIVDQNTPIVSDRSLAQHMPIDHSAKTEARLRHAGLRPTRQRMALASLLYAKGDRHLTVEELHEEAGFAGIDVSLATVYNTLHQFTEARMIRVLAVEGNRTYFDTNVSDHHHFFIEGRNEVLDVPTSNITINNLPEPPEGMEIAHVDVVIRLREKK